MFRLHLAFGDPVRHLLDFAFRDRNWPDLVANEAGNLRRFLDDMPRFIVKHHLDEDVPREKAPLCRALLALDELNDILFRNNHLTEKPFLTEAPDSFFQSKLRLVLKAGISMNNIPSHFALGRNSH